MAESILNQLRKQKNIEKTAPTLEQSSSEIIKSLPEPPLLEDRIDINFDSIKDYNAGDLTPYQTYSSTIDDSKDKKSQKINPLYFLTSEVEQADIRPKKEKISPIVDFHRDNLKSSLEFEREKEIDPINTQISNIEETFNKNAVGRYVEKRNTIMNYLLSSQTKYYKRENILTSAILGVSFFLALGVTTIGLFALWPAFAVAFMTWKIRDEEMTFNLKKDIAKVSLYEKIFSFGNPHAKLKTYYLQQLNSARSETFESLFEAIEQELSKDNKNTDSQEHIIIQRLINDIHDEIKSFNLFEDNPEKSKEIFDSLCLKVEQLQRLRLKHNT